MADPPPRPSPYRPHSATGLPALSNNKDDTPSWQQPQPQSQQQHHMRSSSSSASSHDPQSSRLGADDVHVQQRRDEQQHSASSYSDLHLQHQQHSHQQQQHAYFYQRPGLPFAHHHGHEPVVSSAPEWSPTSVEAYHHDTNPLPSAYAPPPATGGDSSWHGRPPAGFGAMGEQQAAASQWAWSLPSSAGHPSQDAGSLSVYEQPYLPMRPPDDAAQWQHVPPPFHYGHHAPFYSNSGASAWPQFPGHPPSPPYTQHQQHHHQQQQQQQQQHPHLHQHDVLPEGHQTFPPDPYSHAQLPSLEGEGDQAVKLEAGGSGRQLPTPARSTSSSAAQLHGNSEHYSPYHQSQIQHAAPAGTFPAYSSSHTFSYPNTAYPPHSASGGSSGSTPSEAPISPPSTSGSFGPGAVTSPAVITAATNRRRMASAKSSSSKSQSGDGKSSDGGAPVKKPSMSTRQAIELDFSCRFCNRKMANLTLRGNGVSTKGHHEGTFYCSTCVPLPYSTQTTAAAAAAANAASQTEEEATYADTISGAADLLEGINISAKDTRPPPKIRGPNGSITAAKKRRMTEEDVLTCDVCHRDLGTGGVRLVGGAENEKFDCAIEVLCAHCESRYHRCSDCGGGGGSRGVGRWRAKELFPDGRRTCLLSHVRMGSLNDMTYDVWPITSIPKKQLPDLLALCRDLYHTTLLATLAVPDMMESPNAIARSYKEVEKQSTDSWTFWEPLITEDIEAARSSRRYIALRWSTPASRKSKYKSKKKGSTGAPTVHDTSSNAEARSSNRSASVNPHEPPALIRDGKVLAGFILGEHDLLLGSLHVALTLPTGSGESYDAASRLMQSLFRHVQNDIASINHARDAQRLPPLPLLKQAWSLHMIKRDSRIMSRVETRRGFIPVEDYLAKYPDADRSDFAPQRPVFLPPELLKGWYVFVKRVRDDEDEWVAAGRGRKMGGQIEM